MRIILLPLAVIAFGVQAKMIPAVTEPYDVIKVTSEIQGTVYEYNKDIGEQTYNDNILVKINDERIKIKKEFAKGELEQAIVEKEYYTKILKRLENLLKRNNLSESEYDDVLFQLNTATNKINQKSLTLKESEEDLKDTRIYGKDGYIVSKRNIEIGKYVTSGTELYELIDVRKLKVFILTSEKVAPFFNIGQEVSVLIDGKRHIGNVKYKGISMAENTYAYPIVVVIENKNNSIPISKTVFVEYGVNQ